MGDSSRNSNKIKRILKAIDVAFSMYSKIPMPRFEWASEDMKYHLCFFPWVGAVIGLIEYGWSVVCSYLGFGEIMKVAIAIAIPLIITGGFHVDGFMDTMDAVNSYQPREKKLEILKDPHIGAFSVISLLLYMLLAAGFASEIYKEEEIKLICLSFVISRILSGLSLLYFKNAKSTGMLNTSKETADKKIVKAVLFIELAICFCFALVISLTLGAAMVIAFALSFLYYYRMSDKSFGGITGDLAGYYVCISELFALVLICVCGRII